MPPYDLSALRLTGPIAGHGEGPVWFASDQRLRWVDAEQGDILSYDPVSAEVSRHHVDEFVSALRPRVGGGMVVATRTDIVLLDDEGALTTRYPSIVRPGTRFNDGGCDPRGRFYCGTMVVDAPAGSGVLYRLDASGAVVPVLDGLGISNGLAWDESGRSAYFVDSPTSRVDRIAVDADGEFGARVAFAQVAPEHGVPDGLCLDTDGGVWVALWDGGAVHRYDADGALTHVVTVPTPRPTACTFGGADLDELYISSSTPEGDTSVEAGALYVVRPGFAGLPVRAYEG